MKLVLDASVALNWLNLPEQSLRATAFRILQGLDAYTICVPAIWPLEIAHGALRAERAGMADASMLARFREILDSVSVIEESRPTQLWLSRSISLAREHRLTVYDASYLELAIAMGATLATFDQRLHGAAQACGLALLGPPPGLAEPTVRYGSLEAEGARDTFDWRQSAYFTPYFVRYANTASRCSANDASSCNRARMSDSEAIATTGMP